MEADVRPGSSKGAGESEIAARVRSIDDPNHVFIYDLPPGEAIGPYHFEWTDEQGQVTIRTPESERVLDPGEVVCFPAGPDGAEHVRNANDVPARVAITSTKNEVGIVEYPETETVGIWAGETHYMLDRPAQ